MIYRLSKTIEIKTNLEEAWRFFSDPANLKVITPPSLNMRITTPIETEMYPGMIIGYKVHPMFSIPLTWITEITHVKKPYMFVDEQRYGPYRMWHHQHIFKETNNGVIAEDIVDYIMPYGPLGMLAHYFFVARQIDSIFKFRSDFLSKKFGVIDNEKTKI